MTNPGQVLDPTLPIIREGGAWGYVPEEVDNAMMARIFGTAGNGAPLGALFDGMGAEAKLNGAQVLSNAIATGTNPNAVASSLAGVLDVSQQRATVIARNEMLGAYRDAQLANYQANSDVVQGWMWSCAPDACFPAGTLIRTRRGEVPIDQVCAGDEVLTHKGRYRRVKHTMQRQYDGEMVTLVASARRVTATSNHPFLIERQRKLYWVEAGHIGAGDNAVCERQGIAQVLYQRITDTFIEGRIRQPHYGKAQALQEQRLAGISRSDSRLGMPVHAVDLQDGAQIGQEEIDGIRPAVKLVLLQEMDAQHFQAFTGAGFWSRLASRAAIASRRAESLMRHSWYKTVFLAASLAGGDEWRASALLRAMDVVGPIRYEDAPASSTGTGRQSWPTNIRVSHPGPIGPASLAEGSPVPSSFKDFAASLAVLSHAGYSFAALSGAEAARPVAVADGVDFSTDFACQLRARLGDLAALGMRMLTLVFGVAGGRAESTLPAEHVRSGTVEGSAASLADSFHIHSISEIQHHVQSGGTTVYNLEVEDDHSYVAAGFVVHNCMACVFMDGSEHPLDEDMDTHVGCRCGQLPITKSWDDLLSQFGIDGTDIPETSIGATYEPAINAFMKADASTQQALMGKAAYRAWARGDIQLSDLLGVRDDGAWGKAVYQKSLKEMGLNASDYLGGNVTAAEAAVRDDAQGVLQLRNLQAPEAEAAPGGEAAAQFDASALPGRSELPDIQGQAISDKQAAKTTERIDKDMFKGLKNDGSDADKRKAMDEIAANLSKRLEKDPRWQALKADYASLGKSPQEAINGLLRVYQKGFDSMNSEAFTLRELEVAAQREFNLDPSALERFSSIDEVAAFMSPARLQGLQAFVRAQYDETQAWFEARGIDSVRVYRGITGAAENLPDGLSFAGAGQRVDMTLDALSPFTTSPATALDFTENAAIGTRSVGEARAVASVDVPVERILSMARTGFGNLYEGEMVVLGGDADAIPVVSWRGDASLKEVEAALQDARSLAIPDTFSPSALPGEWGAKVEETLGKDTASEWGDALGEHGNLQGPIADRAEAQAWEPLAESRDVSEALGQQLNATVNFDDMHPAVANQFAQTLQVLQADFPEVFDESIQYVGMADQDFLARFPNAEEAAPGGNAMAVSNGPQIAFNPSYFDTTMADERIAPSMLDHGVQDRFYYDGYQSPGATMAHEFGHSLYDWALADENSPLFDKVADFVDKWSDKDMVTLSRQAQENYREAFAEAFSATYYGSPEVLADPMVQDMQQLLSDIRDTLDAGTTAVERDELMGEVEGALRQGDEFDESGRGGANPGAGRKPQLPPGVSREGASRMRYEEWRMAQEDESVYMVFDANGNPQFAAPWNEDPAHMELTPEQQQRIDSVLSRPGSKGAIKVSIWKPEGDGLTPGELRWAMDNGANEIHVLTPNGIDVLSRPVGVGRGSDMWTTQWLSREVTPLLDDARAEAYNDLLADELKARSEMAEVKTPPRVRDYDRMEARIQAEMPQAVWERIADQVDGLEYEHLPLPTANAGDVPYKWQPPKPLLDQFSASSIPEAVPEYTSEELSQRSMADLRQLARDMEVTPARTKAETIDRILAKQAERAAAPEVVEADPAAALRSELNDKIAQRELLYDQQHDLVDEKAALENQQRQAASRISGAEHEARMDLYRATLDKSDPEVQQYFKNRAAYQKASLERDAAKAAQSRAERLMDRLSIQGKQYSVDYAQAKRDYDAAVKAEAKAQKASDKAWDRLWTRSNGDLVTPNNGLYKPEFDSIAGFDMRMQRMGITFSRADIDAQIQAIRDELVQLDPRIADIEAQLKDLEKPIKDAQKQVNKLLAQVREINADLPEALDTTRPFSDVLDLPEGHQPPNQLMNKIDYRMNEPRAITKRRIIDDISTRLQDDSAWQAYIDRTPTPDNLGIYHQYVNVAADARDNKSAKLVADLVRKWGVGYRPGSPEWIAMQMAARDEFGLDAEIHFAYLNQANRTAAAFRAGEAVYARDGDALRAFMRAMYDNTQQWFADHGITEVDVYRGFSWRTGQEVPAGIDWGPIESHNRGVADIELNPFQSFSADINISQGTTQVGGFGGGFATGGDYNLLVGARVPVDRVLSTAQTGFGAKLESEIVVMGRATDTVAYRAGTRFEEALMKQAEEQIISRGEMLYTLVDGTKVDVIANADGTFTITYQDGPQAKIGTIKRGASRTYKTRAGLNKAMRGLRISNIFAGEY